MALFLYGTDSLCRAVQQGAGRRLRGLLARCTANPVAGLLTGAAVTAVLQSSSAVTVMVIAFLAARAGLRIDKAYKFFVNFCLTFPYPLAIRLQKGYSYQALIFNSC